MPRVVLITGGTKNIGKVIAEKFLKNGDKVIIVSRNEIDGSKVAKELNSNGLCQYMKADVTQECDCKEIIDKIVKSYKKIDILINNAAFILRQSEKKPDNILDIDISTYDDVMKTNVTGSLQMIKYAGRVMIDNNEGVIINIGSVIGYLSHCDMIEYCISKAAISMLTKCAALQLAPYGIRCVNLCPGWVGTDNNGLMGENHNNLHMRGRALTMQEIANTVFYLSSNEASAINGSDVFADDGYSSFKGDICNRIDRYLGFHFRKEIKNIFKSYESILLFATVNYRSLQSLLRQMTILRNDFHVFANSIEKEQIRNYVEENRIITYSSSGRMSADCIMEEIHKIKSKIPIDCILIPCAEKNLIAYENVYQVARLIGGHIFWIYPDGAIEKG